MSIETETANLLAVDVGGAIETIVFLMMVLLAGLGHVLKKKAEQRSEKDVLVQPPVDDRQKQAPPQRPAKRLVLQKPAEPTSARPTAQPAVKTRGAGQEARPRTSAPARRPQPPKAAPARPAGPRRTPRRLSPMEHAAELASRAKQITRQLQERARTRSEGERRLSPGEHAAELAERAERVGAQDKDHQFFQSSALMEDPEQAGARAPSVLRIGKPDRQALRRAVLMSEIIQPPLALRPQREFP